MEPALRLALFTILLAIAAPEALPQGQAPSASPHTFLGFDRNDYPGDAALPALRRRFDFTGYWLTNPPGETRNTWAGKRSILLDQGFGFVVLANGKTDAEIKAVKKPAALLGRQDASAAVAAAVREHFPAGTILFLDQEEGGRLLSEQAAYLFAWTETVAASKYLPGVYASGQTVDEGAGQTITTTLDIQQQIAARHLHPIVLWVYQDACPPSNGCTLHPPALPSSGTLGADLWQYAQSPRRRSLTSACARTYAADGNCYLNDAAQPSIQPGIFLDLDVAGSRDPSHGR